MQFDNFSVDPLIDFMNLCLGIAGFFVGVMLMVVVCTVVLTRR